MNKAKENRLEVYNWRVTVTGVRVFIGNSRLIDFVVRLSIFVLIILTVFGDKSWHYGIVGATITVAIPQALVSALELVNAIGLTLAITDKDLSFAYRFFSIFLRYIFTCGQAGFDVEDPGVADDEEEDNEVDHNELYDRALGTTCDYEPTSMVGKLHRGGVGGANLRGGRHFGSLTMHHEANPMHAMEDGAAAEESDDDEDGYADDPVPGLSPGRSAAPHKMSMFQRFSQFSPFSSDKTGEQEEEDDSDDGNGEGTRRTITKRLSNQNSKNFMKFASFGAFGGGGLAAKKRLTSSRFASRGTIASALTRGSTWSGDGAGADTFGEHSPEGTEEEGASDPYSYGGYQNDEEGASDPYGDSYQNEEEGAPDHQVYDEGEEDLSGVAEKDVGGTEEAHL